MRRYVQVGVVVLVLGGIFAMLWPSIRMVKEAAERMRCQNNCKHLGLSWHCYFETIGHTLPGTHPNPNLSPEQRLSWVVALNLDIDLVDLHRKVSFDAAWDDAKNVPFTKAAHPAFTCGSSIEAKNSIVLSYIGVAGIGPDAATLPAEDSRIGAFGYNRTLKPDEFTDGRSNTFLFLESMSGGPWAQGGPGSVRGLEPEARPYHGVGRFFDGDHRATKWITRTTSTITATLCDGSVRTFTETTASEVLEALATVHGKDKLPGDW